MKNKNHPSETLPIDNSYQTGLPLLSRGVFIMKRKQYLIGRYITYLGLRIMGYNKFMARLWSYFGED